MAEEIVRIIKVDTKNSGKSIKDLRNEIKSLRTELEKTEVGSEEFSAALKKLTQTQKEYNSVQEQVRDMSRTNQQNMVRFATFAQNLGKAYSALNAAVGLFADKNEDVQKAMLKVQRTIQLIQGLDGIVGLIRDLPKVAAGFKNWFTALDPVERQVNNIVKGINGVDPAKVKSITEANRLAAQSAQAPTTTATVAGGGAKPLTAIKESEVKENTRILAANGKAAENAGAQFAKLNSALTEYTDLLEKYNDVDTISGLTEEERVKTITELNKKIDESERSLKNELETINVSNASRKEALSIIKNQREMLEAQIKGINDAEVQNTAWYKATSKQIELLKEQEKQLSVTAKAFKGLGSTIKSALSFIWFNAVVIAIVAAISALVNYISKIREAAKEQQRLNKEINQTTNQIASKQIVVLKELALAYGRVGDSAKAKEQFLVDYKDKIKETGIAINDVKTAEDVFVNNTDKYVNAIMARAKAQAVENAAVKIYQEYLDERYDLEQKFADDKNKAAGTNTKEEYITLLQGMGMTADEAEQAWATATSKKQQKILDQIDAADKKVQERLKKMFEDVAELEIEYAGIFASIKIEPPKDDPKYKEWLEQKKRDLETLKKANEDALQVFMDDRTKELQAVAKHYDELIELAKKYGEDTALLEAARQREIQNIIDKYNQQALDDQKKKIDEQYQLIQTEIERIRKMNDTANLRQPREQTFQTVYKGNGVMPFGIQKNWVNVYQSKEDVENQYKAQIEYNNKVYELTKQRIEQENELLKKQLEIEGLDADRRLEIQRTLAENEMALSDAKLDNEQANLDAYLAVQEKKKAALDGVLDVASTSLNAMSNIFRTEAQIHQTESQDLTKSQEEREKAAKKMESAMAAYKAFAITQAIVDTWKSANEAYAAMASIPYVGPALGIAASAAAVISGMANVRAIMSESMTSQSQSSSVTAPSAMQAPPIEYTRNLVGDKELDEINQPIRCYVLEQDVTRVQNKVKVTETNATF